MNIRTFIAALAIVAAPAFAAPQMAITFDDLPSHAVLPPGTTRVDVARSTIAALKAAGVPQAYGLVNSVWLAREPDSAPVLKMWRAAGYPLGNHTWSHMKLDESTVDAYQAEIVRNEAVLAELSGTTNWRVFRYPFLAEGDTPEKREAIRTFLAGRGYRIAPATMMFGDWLYSEPYARCVAKRDTASIAKMEQYYFAAAEQNIAYYRKMSQALYGRDIPYVLLMHIGAFEARTLPKLLALYKAKGFQFVTLEQAEADPHYQAFVNPALPAPEVDLEHLLKAKGLPKPTAPSIYTVELSAMCR